MKKSTLLSLCIAADLIAVLIFLLALAQIPADGGPFASPLVFMALAIFLLGPLLLAFVLARRATRGATRQGNARFPGRRPATATVLETREIRSGATQDITSMDLKLQVNPPDAAPYETRLKVPISPLNPAEYYQGRVIKVLYDPHRPSRVALDPGTVGDNSSTAGQPIRIHTSYSTKFNVPLPGGEQVSGTAPGLEIDPERLAKLLPGLPINPEQVAKLPPGLPINPEQVAKLPPAAQKVIQAALTDADNNGIPDIMEQGGEVNQDIQVVNLSPGSPADRQDALEKLEKVRAAGWISQEQLDDLRKQLG